MNLVDLKELVKDGKIFTVIFTKKNGEERVMNCRLGVKKHLNGGELKFNPSDKGLLPVFDLQKKGYRMINSNTIKEIRIKGEIVTF